jgi:hypothetical protein
MKTASVLSNEAAYNSETSDFPYLHGTVAAVTAELPSIVNHLESLKPIIYFDSSKRGA